MTTQTVTEQKAFEITLHDRCDRCGFRAYMAAVRGEHSLYFCGHHGNQHRIMLDIDGWTVYDETDKLLIKD